MVLSPGILWHSWKFLIADTMNLARAPGLPRKAEGRWPWRGLAACYISRFAGHNRLGVVETPLPVKTQARNMDRSLST